MTRRPVLRWLYTAGIGCLFLAGMSYGWGLTNGSAAADELELRMSGGPYSQVDERRGLLGLPNHSITRRGLGRIRQLMLRAGELATVPLAECTELRWLSVVGYIPDSVDGTAVDERVTLHSVDLSALAGMPHLKTLRMQGISAESLVTLTGLPELEELSLSNSRVKALDGVESLPSLKLLTLSWRVGNDRTPRWVGSVPAPQHSSFSEIRAGQFPSSLERLSMPGIQLGEIDKIGNLANVYFLDVGCAGVTSLDGIDRLKGLTNLMIDGNAIDDFSPLLGCPRLTKVWLTTTGLPAQQEMIVKLREKGIKVDDIPAHLMFTMNGEGGSQ